MFSRRGMWNRVELEKNIGKIQKNRAPKVSEILPFFLLFIIFPPHLFLNFHGIQEVSGSIPLISTKQKPRTFVLGFLFGGHGQFVHR